MCWKNFKRLVPLRHLLPSFVSLPLQDDLRAVGLTMSNLQRGSKSLPVISNRAAAAAFKQPENQLHQTPSPSPAVSSHRHAAQGRLPNSRVTLTWSLSRAPIH